MHSNMVFLSYWQGVAKTPIACVLYQNILPKHHHGESMGIHPVHNILDKLMDRREGNYYSTTDVQWANSQL